MQKPYPSALRTAVAMFAALVFGLGPVPATPTTAHDALGGCDAHAGTLAGFKPSDCLQEGGTAIGGIPIGDAVVPPGFITRWVLVLQPAGTILEVRHVPIFDVYAEGTYSIHTLVLDPNTLDLASIVPGSTTLTELEGQLVQGGGAICAALDTTGTTVLVENPVTGGIVPYKTQDCLEEGGTLIGALPLGGANVPAGYAMIYLFSTGTDQVIVGTSTAPYYTAPDTGLYGIHTLVYDPATLNLDLVQFGTTTIAELDGLLLQGGGGICAALDATGVHTLITICPPEECEANAGTLDGDSGEFGCLEQGGWVTIVAFPNGDAVIPAGATYSFLLVQGDEGVVMAMNGVPEFDVTAVGTYAIHPFVYDPATFDPAAVTFGTTTLAALHAQFVAGGGSLCGAVGSQGATFQVDACPPQCLAYAGTLTPVAPQVCLIDGVATVMAIPNGDSFVPPGFATVYMLTLGPAQVVINAGVLPSFTVNAPGSYGVHAMVFQLQDYNPGTLELGVTTLAQINALLLPGGGTICAGLDMVGATVVVNNCGPGCVADAGDLVATTSQECLLFGSAVIEATPVGNSNVPAGFATVHLLSVDGTITALSAFPSFVVEASGSYTIHALVHDPVTLDLSLIGPGSTTISEVHGWLEQGGGDICGSLGLDGATVEVIDCSGPCVAHAGTLTAADDEVHLAGGSALFFAVANGDMLVPPGYLTSYLLSLDQTVVATAATPVFTVTTAGAYVIHTLVYDPATFDVATIVPGTTVIGALEGLFVQGGGALCGSIDMVGAPVLVLDCTDTCTAYAGTMSPPSPEVCYSAGGTVLTATHNGDAIKPTCFERIHFLSMGTEQVIINASVPASFVVDGTGRYAIHALVFDPATLDPNSVTFGMTTIAQLESLLIQGGGDICASLDVAGAVVEVVDCFAPGHDIGLTVWPTMTQLQVQVAARELPPDVVGQVEIWTLQGVCVLPAVPVRNGELRTLDVSSLRPGQYLVRMVAGDHVRMERFVKAD